MTVSGQHYCILDTPARFTAKPYTPGRERDLLRLLYTRCASGPLRHFLDALAQELALPASAVQDAFHRVGERALVGKGRRRQ